MSLPHSHVTQEILIPFLPLLVAPDQPKPIIPWYSDSYCQTVGLKSALVLALWRPRHTEVKRLHSMAGGDGNKEAGWIVTSRHFVKVRGTCFRNLQGTNYGRFQRTQSQTEITDITEPQKQPNLYFPTSGLPNSMRQCISFYRPIEAGFLIVQPESPSLKQ